MTFNETMNKVYPSNEIKILHWLISNQDGVLHWLLTEPEMEFYIGYPPNQTRVLHGVVSEPT